jgi:hypothetical protein
MHNSIKTYSKLTDKHRILLLAGLDGHLRTMASTLSQFGVVLPTIGVMFLEGLAHKMLVIHMDNLILETIEIHTPDVLFAINEYDGIIVFVSGTASISLHKSGSEDVVKRSVIKTSVCVPDGFIDFATPTDGDDFPSPVLIEGIGEFDGALSIFKEKLKWAKDE